MLCVRCTIQGTCEASDLQANLIKKGDKRHVLLYLDKGAQLVPMNLSDFLVVGPLSAPGYVKEVIRRGISMLVMDELPEIRALVTTFTAASVNNLAIARAAMRLLVARSDSVIAISAQTTRSDVEWLLSLDVDGSQFTVFNSTHIPPPRHDCGECLVFHTLCECCRPSCWVARV